MTDANEELLARLNDLAKTRFQLELEDKDEVASFKTKESLLKAEHELKRSGIHARISSVDADIWELLGEENRSRLIARNKKSFVTMVAKFQFKTVPGSTNVVDAAAVMKVARRFGVIKHIAEPPTRKWKFNIKKFRAWLGKNPEMRSVFGAHIEETEEGESLTIQPNGTYTVIHDSKRISPPSVSVKKKSSSPA